MNDLGLIAVMRASQLQRGPWAPAVQGAAQLPVARHRRCVTRVSTCEALDFRSEIRLCPCDPQACCWRPHVTSPQGCDAVVFLTSAMQLGGHGGVPRGAVWYSAEGEYNRAGPDVATSVGKQSGQELSPGQT